MIPPLIVQQAVESGIGVIAITDHNATANIEAVRKAAQGTDLVIWCGMELQTVEEVHILCIFDSLDKALALQAMVDAALPPVENNIDFFGEQFVVDATGDFIRREERLLLTSTSLTIKDAWDRVTALEGLIIPAHVNRKAFGLLPMLGFVPVDTPFEFLEISSHLTPDQARILYPQILDMPLIQNGDAHFLEDIRGLNSIIVEELTTGEFRKAVLQQAGRSHSLLPK